MKIESSDIALAAARAYTAQHNVQESLRAWVGDTRPNFEQNAAPRRVEAPAMALPVPSAVVHLSDESMQLQSGEASDASAIESALENAENDPALLLIKSLIEFIMGFKIESIRSTDIAAIKNADIKAPPSQDAAATPPAERQGWGVEYEYHERYQESESTSFQASGVIRTTDGKEVKFDLSFALQRSYQEESHTSIRLGDAKKIDPLVLNFAGTSVQLTAQKFSFDLNADGRNENIAFVQGAGFLALDKNGDGKVNDGSELFGPSSGNGFEELKRLDSDANGWIDESDPAFAQLGVWTKDSTGKDQLASLKAANVGALFLGNASTPFSINDAKNTQQAQLVSSGLWVAEDGAVHTMQNIDLVA